MNRIEKYALRMRRKMTAAEQRLYDSLLIALHPFHATVKAQEVIGCYIADFVIEPARVVVECDGSQHETREAKDYDARRELDMYRAGYRTIRFDNWRVLRQTRQVVTEILTFCGDFRPKPRKTPLGAPIIERLPMGRARHKTRKARKRWSEGMFYRVP
jgi:very-short-patch-repair endonuclease